MSKSSTKVIVGMSGGVDSSVTAALLLEQGHNVEGLFMVNWQEDEDAYCSAAEDLQDARGVCDELGIPLHQVDFSAQYRAQVFDYFLAEYSAGRTPNPDVLCNREIKFGAFYAYAKRLGAEKIATGHYARLRYQDQRAFLLKGLDTNKDQSYFLHQAPNGALYETLFPLGELHKQEVREKAFELGLHNHARKDSTGICFIGERPFKEFLSRYIPAQPGKIVTDDNVEVGQHDGLMFHTLGQRQGLNIGGLSGYPEGPWYVVAKRLEQNELVIGQGAEHPLLMSKQLLTGPISWINQPVEGSLSVKIRYRQADQECVLKLTETGSEVVFDTPQRAVAPGQFAVFYQNDVCLGGATITAHSSEVSSARLHA